MVTQNSCDEPNPLNVANGGTGDTTLTNHGLLIGQGTSPVAALGAGTAGQIPVSGGASADPAYVTPTAGTGLTVTQNATTHQYALTVPVVETSGGTNQTTYSQGDILYASAANTLSKLAKDTNSTRVLTNTGTSNNPAWAQVSLTTGVTGVLPGANGGNWVLIGSTQTASNSASISWTSGIDSTYDNYCIVMHNVTPVTNGTNLTLVYSTNGGSSYASSSYASFVNNERSATYHNERQTATSSCLLTESASWGTGCFSGGIVMLNNINYTGSHSATFWGNIADQSNGSTANVATSGGIFGNTAAINALKLVCASGNINNGTFSLYGMTK